MECRVWSVECSVWNVIACHNMPRPPRDLHRVTTSRSGGNAIRKNTQSDTSEVLRLPRKITMEVSKSTAPATKNATHPKSRSKVLRLSNKTTADAFAGT